MTMRRRGSPARTVSGRAPLRAVPDAWDLAWRAHYPMTFPLAWSVEAIGATAGGIAARHRGVSRTALGSCRWESIGVRGAALRSLSRLR